MAQNDRRQISSAVQASIETAQAEHAQRVTSSAGPDGRAAEEAEEEQQPAFTGPAHWAAAAGRSGAAQIRPEDFPALPGGPALPCMLILFHAPFEAFWT